jgi:hypothetical protein
VSRPGLAGQDPWSQLEREQPERRAAIGGDDAEVARVAEAVAHVVVRMTLQHDRGVPLGPPELGDPLDQGSPDAPALHVGMHGHRSDGERRELTRAGAQAVPRGHDVPDQATVEHGHERQRRHEVGVVAHEVDEVVLVTAWDVDVPERLAGQLLDRARIGRGLETKVTRERGLARHPHSLHGR